ncbi:2'-deoxycytidine 5'-triphosphate deaminase domain-containing protein [Shouchella clausii]|uniref:2'-deoxycytidine 5'-triphosphate deaminase domain-containing protein n=1 Tax=Shouchella clausii TaxID=79880 RepID=UPI000BA7053E|nr:2'-deoxycytidine 5'-triphosphate deaminase [Shouchella clausii]PAD90957.1 hypothetical protein CHH52_17090 [Shouchella clausii]
MILSGQTIKQFIQEERILITPFSNLSIQPASIDLRLGEHFLVVDDMSTPLLSVDKPASYHETQVPEGGVISNRFFSILLRIV